MERFLLAVFGCFVLAGCTNRKEAGGTKLTVCIDFAYHKTIYLEREPFIDEKLLKLDSAVVQRGRDTFTFYIPAGSQQRLYAIAIGQSNITIPVINDTRQIGVYYNYSTHKYGYTNSPASQQLKAFREQQDALNKKALTVKYFADSLKARHLQNKQLEDSIMRFNALMAEFFGRYKAFADTVHSPAAFLAVYNLVEFGDDTAALRKFITVSAARFAQDTTIKTLKNNVIDYLTAIGNKYKPGDILPELVLPDENGLPFSTYSLKGRYALLNIWSALCDDCVVYGEAARVAKKTLPASRFEVVNIALDDQWSMWLAAIAKHNYDWPQLNDIKMWNGPAFKTLRFDGIPYNFLVGPDGRLIAKGIKPDSVLAVVGRVVK